MKSYQEVPKSIQFFDAIETAVCNGIDRWRAMEDRTKADEVIKGALWAAVIYRCGWLRLLPWQILTHQFTIWGIMALATVKGAWEYIRFHTRFRREEGARVLPRPVKEISFGVMLAVVGCFASFHFTALIAGLVIFAAWARYPALRGAKKVARCFKAARAEQAREVVA